MTAERQRIGILLCPGPTPPYSIQLLDTAAVDLFGFISPDFLRFCGYSDEVATRGQDYEFLYIAERNVGESVSLSGGLKCVVTHSLETAGKLDILYVPGTEPKYIPSEAMKAFIRQKFTEVKAVLGICTGIYPLARSGILSGRQVTATRTFLPTLRTEFPDVTFVEKRWECDIRKQETEADRSPEVWTSGGVLNGVDLVRAFLDTKFPADVTKVIAEVAEVWERKQEY